MPKIKLYFTENLYINVKYLTHYETKVFILQFFNFYKKPNSSFASSLILSSPHGGSNVISTLASFIIGCSFSFS